MIPSELKTRTRFIAQAGLVAALYVVVSLAFAPTSFGPIQMRISEALCILPYFTLSSIPGLFVGCLISNVAGVAMGLATPWDILFGSLATLLAAYLSYKLRNRKWLVPLPAVLVNAVIIGPEIYFLFTQEFSLWMNIVYIGAGQIIPCYVIGMLLLTIFERTRIPERLHVV